MRAHVGLDILGEIYAAACVGAVLLHLVDSLPQTILMGCATR